MKCGVCSVLESKRHMRLLKESTKEYMREFMKADIPEASGSFKTSDGLTIYICSQHFTAKREDLEKAIKGIER